MEQNFITFSTKYVGDLFSADEFLIYRVPLESEKKVPLKPLDDVQKIKNRIVREQVIACVETMLNTRKNTLYKTPLTTAEKLYAYDRAKQSFQKMKSTMACGAVLTILAEEVLPELWRIRPSSQSVNHKNYNLRFDALESLVKAAFALKRAQN